MSTKIARKLRSLKHNRTLLLLLTLLVTLAAQHTEANQKIPIVYSAFTGSYVPLWIAADLQLAKKYGLELDLVFAGRVKPAQLLLSGQSSYMFNTGTGTVESHVHGNKDFVIIGTIHQTTAVSIMSVPEISRPQDLKGKVVGVGRIGSITDVLGRYALRTKLNLDPNSEVKVLPVGEPSSILPALERRLIHAAVLTTPIRFIAKKIGYRELVNMDELSIEYPNAGITTLRDNIRKNPDQIRKLMRVLVESIYVFKKDKTTSMNVMKRYLKGTSDEILEDTYAYFSAVAQSVPYPSVGGVKTILDILSAQYPQASKVETNEIVDGSFVKEIQDSGFLTQLGK